MSDLIALHLALPSPPSQRNLFASRTSPLNQHRRKSHFFSKVLLPGFLMPRKYTRLVIIPKLTPNIKAFPLLISMTSIILWPNLKLIRSPNTTGVCDAYIVPSYTTGAPPLPGLLPIRSASESSNRILMTLPFCLG